ncbi:MAG TPA: bifunctional (p)ppGpp synthetase/guanosine-3',5'-bis(diphosphate) 3'-pyrophosphohydrolase [Gallionella sp.]|nr:bifunctional (p)ppGpp synthetase/guanosine-3',5'-bis(diphosphate) 3'-pyrophosphohydrolase [Gallionella sp.]
MVSVQHSHSALANHQDADSWLDAVAAHFSADETALIRRAYERAASLYEGKAGPSGTPLLPHALGSAAILVHLNMDAEAIAAALLHAVPDCLDEWKEKLEADFAAPVLGLVEGVARMEQIRQLGAGQGIGKADAARQLESLRKMLLAMVQDIRVVLIKLAERTQTLRELSGADEQLRRGIAQETQRIFAPLANRLGVWQLKWELEDLSVRYLEPELYKRVAKLLDERRVDRERYIAELLALLERELARADIRAEVSGRPKHIYSIVNKMKRKQLDFDELYDVRAVRVLVDDVESCYAVLGLVHDLWQPVPGEFDDYIAHPKSNDYRSLHTAVVGPRGLNVEVQIRTHEMHQHSELGVAAHWRYKEGGKSDAGFDEKIAWLRQILKWKSELAELSGQFREGLIQDRVYVLTPQGRIIDLPKGATPVDFAYALHTDLGHRTRGAKVNGSIVPLGYPLQNGQRVEILTTKLGAPSRDWLSPALGYLQTSSARAKVRHWFRQQGLDDSVAQGRALLERELQRLGAVGINQEKIAQRLRFNKTEELLIALGRGKVTLRRASLAIQQEMPSRSAEAVQHAAPVRSVVRQASPEGVLVAGVGNLMIRLAKCCTPSSPDAIVGYVTRDRGITIHRHDCPFMRRVPDDRRDRVLDAQWGKLSP